MTDQIQAAEILGDQTKIVRVARVPSRRRSQSVKIQSHRPEHKSVRLIRTKTIGPSNRIFSVNNKSPSPSAPSRNESEYSKTSSQSVRITKIHRQVQLCQNLDANSEPRIIKSSEVGRHEDPIIDDHPSGQFNNATNYHKKCNPTKKKKKCSRLCKIMSAFAIVLIVVAILVTLLVLLIKPNTKTKSILINSTILLRWNTSGVTVAGLVSQAGSGSNQLHSPFGLTIDFNNTLYIADCSNHRIEKYFMGASSGLTVAGDTNGTAGTNSSMLNGSATVIVDSNGNLYVTDIYNQRVQFFPNGISVATTIAGTTGSPGNSTDQLNIPYGIARDENSGTLFIADTRNQRIMKYLSGATFGSVIAGNNGVGLNSTQFHDPVSVYLDTPSNSLVIANQFAHNIVRWTLGATSWTLVAGSVAGSAGVTSTLLQYPTGVTLDPMGNVYVADALNHRIQFFPVNQVNGSTIAGISSLFGTNATLLNTPYSLALDSQLNLYVADTNNHRIQKFYRY